jgi:hypothetical protein
MKLKFKIIKVSYKKKNLYYKTLIKIKAIINFFTKEEVYSKDLNYKYMKLELFQKF